MARNGPSIAALPSSARSAEQWAAYTLCAMLRAGLLVVGLVLLTSPAFAQTPPPDPARLDYARPKELKACPEEWYFRAFVAGRFGGVDPFTPDAPRRIALTLGRKSGAFVATLDVYDHAGAYLGGNEQPLVGADCQKLVDHAGGIVVSWLEPLVVPRRTPAVEPPQTEPAPVLPQAPPAQPAPPKPEAPPVPLAPIDTPKPGVFAGRAGFGRALLIGVTAGGVGTGITFEAVAASRGDAAERALGIAPTEGGLPALQRELRRVRGHLSADSQSYGSSTTLHGPGGRLICRCWRDGRHRVDLDPPNADGALRPGHAVSAGKPSPV